MINLVKNETTIFKLRYVLSTHLLVDPREHSRLVVDQFLLLEPQTNFLGGGFNRVGTVADVSTHVDSEVTSDGTWGRLQWVGGTQDGSTLLDNVLTFPDGGQDWARQHVGQQRWEERLGLQVVVVFSQQRFGWLDQFDTDQLVASVFESTQDGGDQSSLDSVGFDSNKGSFVRHS